jgi:uncharacterized repeat protein (TIGR01451 family)
MKTRNGPTPRPPGNSVTRATFHNKRSTKQAHGFSHRFMRFGLLFIIFSLAAITFHSTATAAFDRSSDNWLLALIQANHSNLAEQKSDAPHSESLLAAATRFMDFLPIAPENHSWLMAPLVSQEAVTTYAAGCVTPKSDFVLGETVCVKVTGAPLGFSPKRRINWVNAARLIKQKANLTTDPQTDTFTLPTDSITGIGYDAVDNRGLWRVNSTSTSDGSVRASASFTVSDPANTVSDLSIYKTGSLKVFSGNSAAYFVEVVNRGPDNAQNVQVTDVVPSSMTFASVAQMAGPTFTCSTPSVGGDGSTICTISSLAKDTTVRFTFVYDVSSGAPEGTIIVGTASVSSNTTEANSADNQWNTRASVSDNCTISCPSDLTVQADVGQAGAVVTYTAPTTTGSCDVVEGSEDGGNTAVLTCSNPSGSFFPVGTTNVTCATPSGAVCNFNVTVENPGALTITRNGADPLSVECGTNFNDPGASSIDGSGNDVPVTVSGNLDINTTGTYTLTYTATLDTNSVFTTRTINVVDTTRPTITLEGPNPLTIECSGTFVDPGASAFDSCEGNVAVTVTGTVDVTTPGTYTLTYTATDGNNPTATATRTVIVSTEDTNPPVITLNGDEAMTIECGTTFADPGAVANDACSGNVPATASNTVDTHTPGIYTVSYTATDATGNVAEPVTRTVTVEDTLAPVITLNGADTLTVECHTSFTDPGATANDGCAGSVAVNASGTVDVNTPGSYTLTYAATDGTHSATKTRTVNVVDTTGPVITLNGLSTETVECHTSFTDPGATANDSCAGSVAVNTSGTVNVNTPGSYTITYTASDGAGNAATPVTRTVIVVDTIAPTITLKSALSMWPPNHKYKTFNVTDMVQSVTDSCNTTLGISSVVIEQVTSDEPENDDGDGNTSNDIVIAANCKSVQLRSERSGGGNGRVYSVKVRVKDASGNVGTAVFKIKVPHNNNGTAIEGPPLYTVSGSCP